MSDEKAEKKRRGSEIGRIARNPRYVSLFAGSFYNEYVSAYHGGFKSEYQKFLHHSYQVTSDDSFLTTLETLFVHARAALHIYRELNFKRLITENVFSMNWEASQLPRFDFQYMPKLHKVVAERLSEFLVSESEYQAYQSESDDSTRLLVPVFLHSTNLVFKCMASEIERLELLDIAYPRKINFSHLGNIELRVRRAIATIEIAQKKLASSNISSLEILHALERYKKSAEILHRPSDFYKASGFEQLWIAGLELQFLRRLLGADDNDRDRITESFLDDWFAAHEEIVSGIWGQVLGPQHADQIVSALNFYDCDVLSEIGNNVSYVSSNPEETEKSASRYPKNMITSSLAKLLPRNETISADPRSYIAGWNRQDFIVRGHSQKLIRVFCGAVGLAAIGFVSIASGLVLDNFLVTYCGVGLFAIGTSTMTLTLLGVDDQVELHSR